MEPKTPIDKEAYTPLLEVIKSGTCSDVQREAIASGFNLFNVFYKVEIDPSLNALNWAVNPALNQQKAGEMVIDLSHENKLYILTMLLDGNYTQADRAMIATVFSLYSKQTLYTVRDEHQREVFLNVLKKQ